jgi:hypothetical protein
MEALRALRDLIGWNLHWRWNVAAGAFRITFYEPIRDRASLSGFTPDWTFGPDDYYDLPGVKLSLGGVRTAGELLYLDADGVEQTETDDRSGPTAAFGDRFMRLDYRGSRSIQTQAQAAALIGSVLDDVSVPPLLQKMDAPFHWPVELCDVHNFTTNDVHYDTTQTLAVFGYTHILEPRRIRTLIDSSGQPSGGYRRWLAKEHIPVERAPGIFHADTSSRATSSMTPVTLQSVILPGGYMGRNGSIRITAVYKPTGTANNKVLEVQFDDQRVARASLAASSEDFCTIIVTIANTGSELSQHKEVLIITDAAISTHDLPGIMARDTTAPIEVEFIADVDTGTDSIALMVSRIEYLGQAAA